MSEKGLKARAEQIIKEIDNMVNSGYARNNPAEHEHIDTVYAVASWILDPENNDDPLEASRECFNEGKG